MRARGRAMIHVNAVIDDGGLVDDMRQAVAKSPERAERAMALTVGDWEADTIRHIPVRASRNMKQGGGPQYRRVGRGQLKKSTRGWVNRTQTGATGGIRAATHYAIWLLAGTRHIAGGRVMRWRLGDRPITDWPAKREGGNPRAELPIILPTFLKARDTLSKGLLEGAI